MIIEVMGLPRSGKSTVIRETKLDHKIIIHEEFFDENPYTRSDHNTYNLWYAQEIAKKIKIAIKEGGDHLFQRGALDRISFAEALFEFGLLSKETLTKHKVLLTPLVKQTDKIILCSCSIKESMNRDNLSSSITGNQEFLKILDKKYKESSQKYRIIKIDTEQDLLKSVEEVKKAIK